MVEPYEDNPWAMSFELKRCIDSLNKEDRLSNEEILTLLVRILYTINERDCK